MQQYPKFSCLLNKKEAQRADSDASDVGKALLNYILIKISFVNLKDKKLYSMFNENLASYIKNVLRTQASEKLIEQCLGCLPSSEIQIIEKEVQKMIMMESLDESSYVYYEECSLYTDLSEVPTKQIINQQNPETKDILSSSLDQSNISIFSVYQEIQDFKRQKEYSQKVSEYVQQIQTFNGQLTLLVQKIKCELSEWEKNKQGEEFVLQNSLSVAIGSQFQSFKGRGVAKNIKQAKENASKEIIEKVYNNAPYIWYEIQELKSKSKA